MDAALNLIERRDRAWAQGITWGLHVLLALVLFGPLAMQPKNRTVLLTIETVSGVTPRGEGTGAEGMRPQISDTPANPSPLAAGLQMRRDEALSANKPQAKPQTVKARVPTASELAQRYEKLKVGINPREGREAGEPSEGGMGNNKPAGSPDGLLDIEGVAGGRGYWLPDMNYPGALPEESEAEVLVTISPKGEVTQATLTRSSGYASLNQHVLAKAREIRFAPLPVTERQEEQAGAMKFRFDFSGRSSLH